MATIAAILNTFNEGHVLRDCLESICSHVDEIIVTDMKSSDGSQRIAKEYGCLVIPIEHRPIVEETINEKVLLAHSDWIFALDPDMRVPLETWKRIHEIVDSGSAEAIVFRMRNQVFGRWTDHGHGSDACFHRLFRRDKYLERGVPPARIHTMLKQATSGLHSVSLGREFPIMHVAYKDVRDALYQHLRYAEYEALHLVDKQQGQGLVMSLYRLARKLFGDFVIRGAWRGGKESMVFSIIAALMMIQRDLLSWDCRRQRKASPVDAVGSEIETSHHISS